MKKSIISMKNQLRINFSWLTKLIQNSFKKSLFQLKIKSKWMKNYLQFQKLIILIQNELRLNLKINFLMKHELKMNLQKLC